MCGTQGIFCPWGQEPAADGAGTQVFCLSWPDTSHGACHALAPRPSDTVHLGIQGVTFHRRVLTQLPVSSVPSFTHTVGARRHPASCSAFPKLHRLYISVTKERAKLDQFQESKK